jgi:hypothetical protein
VLEKHSSSSMISDDPLRLSCGSTCIKYVKRMIRIDIDRGRLVACRLYFKKIVLIG